MSRINALKHGLTSDRIVIPGEDPEEFDDLKRQLEIELDPVGCDEMHLVERMAACMWRLRQLYTVEAGIFAFERAGAELELAWRELDKYEKSAFVFGRVSVTDETRHAQARSRVERGPSVRWRRRPAIWATPSFGMPKGQMHDRNCRDTRPA